MKDEQPKKHWHLQVETDMKAFISFGMVGEKYRCAQTAVVSGGSGRMTDITEGFGICPPLTGLPRSR